MIDAVAAESMIANYQLIVRQGRLQIRFQPAVVLHAVGESIADEDDVSSRLQLHGRWCARGHEECQAQQNGSLHRIECFLFLESLGLDQALKRGARCRCLSGILEVGHHR